jgi:pimeloyl-ACP methyl ester carboxylesterase
MKACDHGGCPAVAPEQRALLVNSGNSTGKECVTGYNYNQRRDRGKGQPIVFSHGWPLSADDWDTQMLFFLKHGYRVIAHDRRGHGRSTVDACAKKKMFQPCALGISHDEQKINPRIIILH